MRNGRIPSLPIEDMAHFLTKQHEERDHLFAEVASLVVESEGFSDDPAIIQQVIDKDVSYVLQAIGK